MTNRPLLPQDGHGSHLVDIICRAICEALEYAGVGLVLTDRRAAVRLSTRSHGRCSTDPACRCGKGG
jgi:hypothetical protein